MHDDILEVEERPLAFRVPPQDLEAEQSVLGAMLLAPEAAEIVLGILAEDDFYREAHRILFLALQALHQRKEPKDVITISNELRMRGHFDAIGGLSTLTTLINRVPTSANAEFYATIVKEKSLSRRLITETTCIVADAYEDRVPIKELLDTAIDRIESATGQAKVLSGPDWIQVVGDIEHKLAKYHSGEEHYYISSGFFGFDAVFGGFERGKLTIIRGRPKEGKTLLIHNAALQIAAQHELDEDKPEIPVGYIYIDSGEEDMVSRSLALCLNADIKRITSADRSLHPLGIPEALSFLKRLPFHLKGQRSFGQDPDKYVNWIRRAHREFGISIFFIDSVSVLNYQPTRDKNLERIVAEFANRLVSLAAQENVAIVAVSEVSNDQENGFKTKYSGRWDFAAHAVYDVTRQVDEKTDEFTDVMEVTAALHRGSMYGKAMFYGKDKTFRLKNMGGGFGDGKIFKFKGGTDE